MTTLCMDNHAFDSQKLLSELIENNTDPEIITELLEQLMEENKYSNKIYQKPQKKELTIIEKDLENAYECIPEFFFPVDMIYIPIKLHNNIINAFVDTGAQMSIIGKDIVEKLGLMERINTDYKTTLVGVGQSNSLGKIFNLEIELGGYLLNINATVVEKGIEFLLGLDVLKNHKLTIDFENNCIKNSHLSVNFVKHTKEKLIPM